MSSFTWHLSSKYRGCRPEQYNAETTHFWHSKHCWMTKTMQNKLLYNNHDFLLNLESNIKITMTYLTSICNYMLKKLITIQKNYELRNNDCTTTITFCQFESNNYSLLQTTVKSFCLQCSVTRRRFKEFEWLHKCLKLHHPLE